MSIPPVRSQGDSGHIQDHNDIGTELAARLPLSGGTLTGAINGTSATFTGTVSAATPTENSHLATKEYVDSSSTSGVLPYAMSVVEVGPISASIPAGGTSIMNVSFPSGRFTVNPMCFATVRDSTHPFYYENSVLLSTYTAPVNQAGIWMRNLGSNTVASDSLKFRVLGIQMTSSTGVG